MLQPKQTKPPKVKLDWKAYYKEFRLEHGDYPVIFKGMILFRDGWMYSKTDYAGPEFPPPEDEADLKSLQLAYWNSRRQVVRLELIPLERTVDSLLQFQSAKSCRLQQKVIEFDDETQKDVTNTVELDITIFEGRLDWLRKDLEDCERNIASLNGVDDDND